MYFHFLAIVSIHSCCFFNLRDNRPSNECEWDVTCRKWAQFDHPDNNEFPQKLASTLL